MIFEINTWLEKPETHRLYSEGLELLEEFGSKRFSNQLQQIRCGYNMPVLVHCLTLLNSSETSDPKPTKNEPPKIVIHHTPAPVEKRTFDPTQDKDFFSLQKELRQAIHQRMRMSDSFHNCESDLDRLRVCEQIEEQTRIINEYQTRIDDYKKTGTMESFEDLKKANEFQIADTYEGLLKQQKILTDKIRRCKIRIQQLLGELEKQENYRTRMKLENKEKIRKELQIQKNIIKEKLDDERKNNRQ
jgi:hypothetical protein